MKPDQAHPAPPSGVAARLLAELTCRAEERQGHPEDDPSADQAAIAVGGSFEQRVHTRAWCLSGGDQRLARVTAALTSARIGLWTLCTLAAFAGASATGVALSAPVISVPLLLVTLVGVNLLMLLAWLLFTLLGGHPTAWLGALWQAVTRLWRRTSGISGPSSPIDTDIAAVLLAPPLGRWWLASVVHAAWLSYAVAGTLMLALLLSLREVPLSWHTTLLDPATLHRWAQALSWLPEHLGWAPERSTLPLTGDLDAAQRQVWARWLVATAVVYGALPRGLALLICAGLAWRARSRLGRDMGRAGYARLRARLLPDRRDLGVVDAAPHPARAGPSISAADAVESTRRGTLYAAALEWPAAVPEPGWHWQGAVDRPEQRQALIDRLSTAGDATLLILVRAAATPDRGTARSLEALVTALPLSIGLVLDDLPRLEARGAAVTEQRLADWQALAAQVGIPVWRRIGSRLEAAAESAP